MNRLVLLSGWGIDARIWRPLEAHWPADLEVTTPDWPGYGARPGLDDPDDLAALAAAMAGDLSADAVWAGWSLGGLLAAALLDHLPAPRALVLLGMGPRFCTEGGIPPQELAAFRRAFARDGEATRQHFLRWQLQGEPAPRAAHRRLIDLIGREPGPEAATLAAGLERLATLDVSARLDAPPCPVHRIAGERDPLLAPALRASAEQRLAGAGHCPMLSRPDALAACLTRIARAPAPTAECPS
ncbi:alpha/beta fold hydrolase [Halomonas kalidii]|uniref:Alpha/beta fold hydrolase n=1 Tax=Halomonas kalidii TaxID=3043293 RepID=A0ABT6VK58_9GAMM|nr:alpha/beta fold hydrolase [Halomonas kalidii]MDI5934075.1 alpha/beta fold hydrolase [Halomonas kalidii]